MCMPSSALLHDASRCQSSPGRGSNPSYMLLPLPFALHCSLHRHGARTPLNTLFWPDSPYSDCHNTYPGPEIRLFDETGLPNPPPVLDLVSEANSPAAGWGVRVQGQLTLRRVGLVCWACVEAGLPRHLCWTW